MKPEGSAQVSVSPCTMPKWGTTNLHPVTTGHLIAIIGKHPVCGWLCIPVHVVLSGIEECPFRYIVHNVVTVLL